MDWLVLAFIIFFVIVFLAGAHWGYRGGVAETEQRWSESAKRYEAYHNDMVKALRIELSDTLRRAGVARSYRA